MMFYEARPNIRHESAETTIAIYFYTIEPQNEERVSISISQR